MLLLTALLGMAQAQDQDPPALAWQWTAGQTRTWHLESLIGHNYYLSIITTANREAQVRWLQVEGLLTCEALEPLSSGGWELRCVFDQVAVSATPAPDDTADVRATVAFYQSSLETGWLQVEQRADGRLKHVDLEGLPETGDWANRVEESLRQLLMRGLAGLDLGLPADAELPSSWDQRSEPWLDYPSMATRTAKGTMTHSLLSTGGELLSVRSAGTGTLIVPLDGLERSFTASGEGHATFDAQAGQLASREWVLIAKATPDGADGYTALYYAESGQLDLLDPAEPQPTLAGSGLFGDDGVGTTRFAALESSDAYATIIEDLSNFQETETVGGYGWVTLTGQAAWRPGFTLGGAGSVAAGWRVDPGLHFGLGVGATRFQTTQDFLARHDMPSQSFFGTFAVSPERRVSPRVGVTGGVDLRRFTDADTYILAVPWAGIDLGLTVAVAGRHRLVVSARGRGDLRRTEVTDGVAQPVDLPRIGAELSLGIITRATR